MAPVELLLARAIVGVVVLPARAELCQRRPVRLGQVVDQAAGAGDELGDARRRAGEDEADDALGAAGHVVDCEPPAPRLAEEVARSSPSAARTWSTSVTNRSTVQQRRVVGRVRPAAPELVVDDRRSVL